MITRAYVERTLRDLFEKANYGEFEAHAAPGFVYEFMGTQPCSGLWEGTDAVRRQFKVFAENFTAEFRCAIDEIYFDAEKNTAALRVHSHPLTDLGGGDYRQHCAWFVYFTPEGKITRVVDYSDTKLVDEMTVRVETARMNRLKKAQAAVA